MVNNSVRAIPNVSDFVAGVFTDIKNAKDAILDLARAGFSPTQISIAYANESQMITKPSENSESDLSSAGHSLPWRLKQSFQADLYRKGEEQIKGDPGFVIDEQTTQLYTEVDLTEALTNIGVSQERILLLDREIGSNGVFILVNALGHSQKAQEIIEGDGGTIRTESAAEIKTIG